MANEQALGARAPDRGGDARRPQPHVLHERRRRGERERGQGSPAGPRAATRSSRATAPTTARRPARSRSPAIRAAGSRSRACRASCACSTRTPTAARPATPTRARSAPARPHLEEILQYEGAHTVAAVILETVTGTNGHHRAARRLPAVDPRDLRPPRDPADRRRGDGRLRPHRQVVRRASNWDVVPDIITIAKGINSGYVPLGAMTVREHVYDALKDRFFAGGLTYSGHPLACAVGRRLDRGVQGGGDRRERGRAGRVPAERARAASQDRHPSIGDVRGLGLFWGLELVREPRATQETLVPFNAGGEAAAPVHAADEGGAGAGPLPLRRTGTSSWSARR